MFCISKQAGQSYSYGFLFESKLCQSGYLSRQLLLVAFGYFQVFVVEGVSAKPDSHPYGPDVVVIIDCRPVVPRQVHYNQFPDDTQEYFIAMQNYDVIHEPEIVRESVSGILLELCGQKNRPTGKVVLFVGEFSCKY